MKLALLLLSLACNAWSQAILPEGDRRSRREMWEHGGRLNRLELDVRQLQRGVFSNDVSVAGDLSVAGTISAAFGNVSVSTGGLFITGNIGSGTGHFRTDTGVEVQGTSAGYSCFETRNPGAVNSDECFLVFGAYDDAGAAQKTMSISSKWADAAAATGYGVLRFNATYLGGTQDDLFLQGFGNKGISVFGPDSITYPGNKIMKVYGRVQATNVDAGSMTVTGTTALGPLSVNAQAQLSGNAYYNARFQDLTGSKGVIIGYDTSTTVGIISSDQGNSALSFWTHDGISFGERVRISSAGNVGFFTEYPTRAVDISTKNPIIQLERLTNTDSGVIEYVTNGTQDWLAGERDTTDSDYHLFSFGTTADVLTARRATGNIGIGITNPATKLDVNGSAQFGNAATKSAFTATGSLSVPYGITAGSVTASFFYGVSGATETTTAALVGVGTIDNPLGVNSASVTVRDSSGFAPSYQIDSSSIVKLSGGLIQNYQINSSSIVKLSGGFVPNFEIDASSVVKMISGFVPNFEIDPSSIVKMASGLVPNALIDTSSVVKLSAGLVPNFYVDGSSITKQGNIFNGASQLVRLDSNSAAQLYGSITATTGTFTGATFSIGGTTVVISGGFMSIGGNGAITQNAVIRLNAGNDYLTLVSTSAGTTSIGYLGFGSADSVARGTPVLSWTTGSRVGIGTTTPRSLIDADKGTGVGQFTLDGSTGGCIMLRDTDDAGWTECDALDGVLTCSIDADGQCD